MVRRGRGFTYLAVLFALALLSAGLGLLGQMWHTAQLREKEADLLHLGGAYRRAIMLYYESSPGGLRRYPQRLESLVRDERYPGVRRYLRKLYPDPVSGAEWGLMRAPDGGIMGVYSQSREAPLKTRAFGILGAGASYSDWKFFYQPAPVVVSNPAVSAPR